MTVSATTFLTRFPEFGNIEIGVVRATLAEANRQCDVDGFFHGGVVRNEFYDGR